MRKIIFIIGILIIIVFAFQVQTSETIYPGAVFTNSSAPKTGLDSIRVYIAIDTSGIIDSISFMYEIGYGLYATTYTTPDSQCVLRFIFHIISADSDSVDQSYMWSEYLVGYGGVDSLDAKISSRAEPITAREIRDTMIANADSFKASGFADSISQINMQASIDSIPKNPLLDNDPRIDSILVFLGDSIYYIRGDSLLSILHRAHSISDSDSSWGRAARHW